MFLDALLFKYARDRMEADGRPIEHSQHLLCGRGFWQIGDPPWLVRMERLGFRCAGAPSFFIEQDWAPLPAIHDEAGRPISNLDYNRAFGLPGRYQGTTPPPDPASLHLPAAPAGSDPPGPGSARQLQYFQTLFPFT